MAHRRRSRSHGAAIIVVVGVTVLTACGVRHTASVAAASHQAAASPSSSRVSGSIAPRAGYGKDAAVLLDQVDGCAIAHDVDRKAISAISPALARNSRAVSAVHTASSCMLKGHPVLLLTFTDTGKQETATSAVRATDAFYADGAGWVAVSQESEPAPAQDSIVQSVAVTLAGRIERGSAS